MVYYVITSKVVMEEEINHEHTLENNNTLPRTIAKLSLWEMIAPLF